MELSRVYSLKRPGVEVLAVEVSLPFVMSSKYFWAFCQINSRIFLMIYYQSADVMERPLEVGVWAA